MERQITIIIRKMIFVLLVIAALATWQHEFIISGIASHLYMNVTILGTFAFGVINAFLFISKLKNEVVAFRALKEMSDDIRRVSASESLRDPLWRYRRALEPANVFRRPRLLGHAYDLVTEELARTKKIRVSVETMNTLVHKIEETINDEKSLVVYISGLLVFMGLIGTFIGLLHMVGAIGGIIGSLAKTSGGGNESGAFQQLLGALEEPLRGMASGFASSLFGLFSSLVVGLMARFAGQAAGVLKGGFESWLAGVVQLREEDQSIVAAGAAESAGAGDPALIRMVGSLLSDYSRVAGAFDGAARSLQEVRSTQSGQQDAFTRLADRLDSLISAQRAGAERLDRISACVGALAGAATRWERQAQRFSDRLELRDARFGEVFSSLEASQTSAFRLFAASETRASAHFAQALAQLSEDIERRTSLPSIASLQTVLSIGLREGVSEGLAEHTRLLEDALAMLAGRIQSQLGAATPQPSASNDGEIKRAIESAFSEGFERLSHSMENAFSAYSSLLHVALAALERSGVSGESKAA